MSRDYNIDKIKALAIIFVISIHSLFHIGYYESSMSGMSMMVLSILRTYWVTCVPLFLIATGWLQGDKLPNKRHYVGLVKVLVVYLISGVFCQAFVISMNLSKGVHPDILNIICSFTNFTAAPYGWYVGMFVGLYLLIPFINIIWHHITRNQKYLFLASLFVLTILPNTLNSFDFNEVLIFSSTKDSYTIIADSFWVQLYPLTYYCFGMYFRDNKDHLNNIGIGVIRIIGGVILLTTFLGIYNYLRYNDTFGWSLDVSYGGLQPFLVSLSLILLITTAQSNTKRHWLVRKVIEYLSKNTLPIYLLSYVTDAILYHCVDRIYPYSSYWIIVITVPISILMASAIAYPTMQLSTTVSRSIINIIENK